MEYDDRKLRYSVCQFFSEKLTMWSKEIQREAQDFNLSHEQVLRAKGWNLREHVSLIVEYLSNQE